MTDEPYNDGARSVNSEPGLAPGARREVLLAMGLIRTQDLLDTLGTSKTTLAVLRKYGLEQIGEGKQKFYHVSDVGRAMRVAAMVRRACGSNTESTDGEA